MELGVTLVSSLKNPDLGDLALEDAGTELVRTQLADEVSQRIHVRMKFFRGEWFLNLNEGAPYYQSILIKGPSDSEIRFIFTTLIRQTEGVSEVTKLDYSISSTRRLSLTFQARLEDGSLFRSTSYPAYEI